jgi:hypothetical protein
MVSLLSKFNYLVTFEIASYSFSIIYTIYFVNLQFRLENQEYDDSCTGRATVIKEENHVYQTLKLNEMNYESMYAKIMPTKK